MSLPGLLSREAGAPLDESQLEFSCRGEEENMDEREGGGGEDAEDGGREEWNENGESAPHQTDHMP